ncbi:MAG TPA: DUF3018 family protein [Candidatus Competibacteraceae bacterium]|nr:DUF3018 family protein [Candidatus Competibacteraceae bacterium]
MIPIRTRVAQHRIRLRQAGLRPIDLWLPADLHRRLKTEAARQRKRLGDVIAETLDAKLSSD